MKITDYIPFSLRQIIKLVIIFNRPEWYRHTDVFLLKFLLKYSKNNMYSVFRLFFFLRYPKMWKNYSELISLALENEDHTLLRNLTSNLSTKIELKNIKIEHHVLMLINIYQIFLFFGMCSRGLVFRSEARNLFCHLYSNSNLLADISHPLRVKGFWIELASNQYFNNNENPKNQIKIPTELLEELSKTQLNVTAALSEDYKKLLKRGVILRGPSQTGKDYKKESNDTLVVMNPKSNTRRLYDERNPEVPVIGFYNGEQYHYLKKMRKKVPQNLDYYCFKNDKYLPTAKRMVAGDNIRSFELCDDWLFNGTSNALQNILFDFAMSSASKVSICYFDLMLSISRSSTYYPEEWGRSNEQVLKEVIRSSCATSEDPISQFHFARFILFEYGFSVDDQLNSAISITEQEFAKRHESVYSR